MSGGRYKQAASCIIIISVLIIMKHKHVDCINQI